MSLKQMREALDSVTFEALKKHYETILNSEMFVESLTYGNATKKDALEVYNYILKKHLLSKGKGVPKNQIKNFRALAIPKKEKKKEVHFRFMNFNEVDDNSAICNDMFCGKDSPVRPPTGLLRPLSLSLFLLLPLSSAFFVATLLFFGMRKKMK